MEQLARGNTAFAFLILISCVLALATDVRAGPLCNTTQYKGQALEGLWQYQLGSNSCTPLTGVKVTVVVEQDIIVGSYTKGQYGFSMQLNANGASSGLKPTQLFWQQFIIEPGSGSVEAFTQQFAGANQTSSGYLPSSQPQAHGEALHHKQYLPHHTRGNDVHVDLDSRLQRQRRIGHLLGERQTGHRVHSGDTIYTRGRPRTDLLHNHGHRWL